jgi:predicted LPLAT superfamily acyltransferase
MSIHFHHITRFANTMSRIVSRHRGSLEIDRLHFADNRRFFADIGVSQGDLMAQRTR